MKTQMTDKEYKQMEQQLKKKFENYECEGQMTIDDYFNNENEEERERE